MGTFTLLGMHSVGHGLDVSPGSLVGGRLTQFVAVVGSVGQQDVALAEAGEHVPGATAIMGLALGDLQGDRQSIGVDQGVDLGGQPAPRAPHASGSSVVPREGCRAFLETPFFAFAPCW